ncbi:hypothetical protein AOLI_G00141860 [Acnodon oligacanthus]
MCALEKYTNQLQSALTTPTPYKMVVHLSSNHVLIAIMDAFPPKDHASDLKDLDLGSENLPAQRSLGLLRDLNSDCFMFRVLDEEKSFTRRGVLPTVNILFDPLGFVAPVTIQGKALLREITIDSSDWDAPLTPDKEQLWRTWKHSFKSRHIMKKVGPCPIPDGNFFDSDLYRQQRHRAQSLANTFRDKWRKQHLSTLQSRKKWQFNRPDLLPGSVVLLKDSQSKRNDWPLGIVMDVYPSKDGKVRKVQVKISKQYGQKLLLRPFNEGILFVPPKD